MTSKQRGYTLLELMVTLTVASVVLATGVPSITALTRTNRVAADTNDLVATLHLARNEAIKSVGRVTTCTSVDLAACDGAAAWSDGWISFVDTDADAVRDVGEDLLTAHGAISTGNTLVSAPFLTSIAFRPDGFVVGSHGNSGTFALCHEDGTEFGRTLTVTRAGSLSLAEGDNGGCP